MRLSSILIAPTLLLLVLGCSAPEPQAGIDAQQLSLPDHVGVAASGPASLVPGAVAGTQATSPMLWNLKAPTATRLSNGVVLIVEKNRAQLYDSALDTWSAAAPPLTARTYPAATLLPDGKVLLAGGYDAALNALASAELYDPATNTWSATAPMSVKRANHTATLLLDGRVLIVGGYNNAGLDSTDLYDPVAHTWSPGPTMSWFHFNHTATLLADGDVLVAGSGGVNAWSMVDLFDAATNTWSSVASMHIGRQDHTATLLPDGDVLVAGGYDPHGSEVSFSSAEIYSRATQSWTWTGAMSGDRTSHTATLLPSGKVLVTGGEHVSTVPFHSYDITLSTTELFDPTSGTWAPGPLMQTARTRAAATLLTSGRALIAGGGTCPTAELITSTGAGCAYPEECPSGFCVDGVCCDTACAAGACDACSVAVGATANGTCTALTGPVCDDDNACTQNDVCQAGACVGAAVGDGAVCSRPCLPSGTCSAGSCVGAAAPDGAGCDDGDACTSGDVCQAGACAPGIGVTCSTVDTCHDAGSCDPSTGLCSSPMKHNGSSCPVGVCQIGACVSGVSWRPTGGVDAPPQGSTATLLLDGRVLSFGGVHGAPTWGGFPAPALYDPKTDSWSLAGPVSPSRRDHTATRLANGNVLIVGGDWVFGPSSPPPANLIYNPVTSTWTDLAPAVGSFLPRTATLLPSGKVFGLGGPSGSGWIYDPDLDLWTPTAAAALYYSSGSTATLLPSGKVFAAQQNSMAEIYDPATDIWSPIAPIDVAMYSHSAVLLSSGKVLILGKDADGALSRIYDPAADTWATAAPMQALRTNVVDAVVLDDGTVLVAGAQLSVPCDGSRRTERYDPQADAWIPALPTIAEGYERLTKLDDGRVLATSAETSAPMYSVYTSSAELFDGVLEGAAPAGVQCGANAFCTSGFCVDGVCCDSACAAGACDACAAALGASADGTCTLLAGMGCNGNSTSASSSGSTSSSGAGGAGGAGTGGGVSSSSVGAGGSASSSSSSGVSVGGGSSSANSGVGVGGSSSSVSSGVSVGSTSSSASAASSGVGGGSSSASSGVGVGGSTSSVSATGAGSSASVGGSSVVDSSNSGCGTTGLPAPSGAWLGLGVLALGRRRRRRS